ncbi:MAG: TolC family protein, partial [Deltaproteobacteria bacterium]
LKQLDAAIAAQERILTTSKRAFWLPTFSIDAFVRNIFAKEGEGTTAPSIGPISIPQKDDTDWSVGVFATFPLIEGGGKFATIKRAREDLSSLSLDRASTAEKVEERVRVAVDETGFSYPSIRLSREGSQAAARNLDLVTEQYVRGVVSIIDLLDAQNNALVAAEKAENAVYTFLINLMDVQRAMGRFDFYLSVKEREAWFQRLEVFFRKAGVAPRWR